MKTFDVYQPFALRDKAATHDQVSAKLDLMMAGWGKPAATLVRRGMEEKLFVRTWKVRVDELTEVFGLTNGFPDAAHHEVLWKCPEAAVSGSVGGMVAIERDGRAWLCVADGWSELTDDVRALFPSEEEIEEVA